MDLVQWLTAQLDEDERVARAASGEEWGAVSPTQPYVIFDVAAYKANKTLRTVGAVAGVEHAEDRAHIAEHDPARVLREIEAKRGALARYEFACTEATAPNVDEEERETRVRVAAAFQSCVLLFASVYSDRPGFQESWRP